MQAPPQKRKQPAKTAELTAEQRVPAMGVHCLGRLLEGIASGTLGPERQHQVKTEYL